MTVVRRRPAGQPVSYEPTAQQVANTKAFNKSLRYTQGYRTAIGAGASVPLSVSLNSAGKMLLGVAFIPSAKTSDISDVQVNLTVNNNNLLLNVSAGNANPLDTQGFLFFPTPQPLNGNDIINITFTNNSASQLVILTDVFYVPR